MAYTSQSDLQKHFGSQEVAELLDRDNDGTEDAGVMEHVLLQTDSIIDGYLAALYETPLDPVPQLIACIASDIARYLLYSNGAPEMVQKRYDDAIKQLKDIAKGLITLPSTTAQVTSAGGIEYVEGDRLFTMDTLRDF